MATVFLPTANSLLSSSSSSSSQTSSSASPYFPKGNGRRQLFVCKAVNNDSALPILTKRSLSISLTTAVIFSLAGGKGFVDANAAILEADDDLELLEKVKKDRKKRIERQGVISSSSQEKASLQDVVYKLSKVGQAIENNDLSTASSVLGQSPDSDWVQKANAALSKLSSSPEEKTEVDTFKSSLVSLISLVTKNDVEASKLAFVSSASALEKWTTLNGLIGQLKGL